MQDTYEFHEQVRTERVADARRAGLRRQLIAQRRARRRLERAERAALRARLVLSATGESPALRLEAHRA